MKLNSHLEWKVPYQPGVLEARGSRGGRLVTTKIETTGKPVRIQLSADRTSIHADGEDVSVVTVRALDERGRDVPIADNLIQFDLQGKGKIIGVGNGDPSSHEPDKYLVGRYQRHLFNGLCQVIIQSSKDAGSLELRATAEGLKSTELTVRCEAIQKRVSVQ
jgi:beta-galactosidase